VPVHPADIAVGLLAGRQAGTFSVAQAKAVGADDAMIWRRRRARRWNHPAPGVLSLPGFPEDEMFELWFALHDAGPGAMAACETAAALQGSERHRITPVSVLVGHGQHHRNAVATVHQTRRLPTPVLVRGIPVTPMVRTVLDLAATTKPVALGRLVDHAVVAQHVPAEALQQGLEWMQRTRRAGAANLSRALEGRTHGYVPPRSELERLLDAIIATLGCPPPEHEVDLPTHPLEPHRVDRLFRAPPLIVEGDGRLWHARLQTMDQDRRRDRRALRLGYPTVRYGWHELRHCAADVQEELLDLLGLTWSVSPSLRPARSV
jgi:hypothetical protein